MSDKGKGQPNLQGYTSELPLPEPVEDIVRLGSHCIPGPGDQYKISDGYVQGNTLYVLMTAPEWVELHPHDLEYLSAGKPAPCLDKSEVGYAVYDIDELVNNGFDKDDKVLSEREDLAQIVKQCISQRTKPQTKVRKVTKTDKEDPTMSDEEGTQESKIKNFAKSLGSDMAMGAKLAVADQTGELLLNIARKMAEKQPFIKLALESEDGREFIKLALAGALKAACQFTELVPKAQYVEKGTSLVISASTAKLAGPYMGMLQEALIDAMGLGEKIEQHMTPVLPQTRVEVKPKVEPEEAMVEKEEKTVTKKAKTVNGLNP